MSCPNCEKYTPQVDGDSYEACQTAGNNIIKCSKSY